jgi:hypothetical protein
MSENVITYYGEKFKVAESISLLALGRFAKAAAAGVDSQDMEGLVALHDIMQQCIADEDWPRFEALADKNRDQGDELMKAMQEATELISGRPTKSPSGSSDGPPSTSGSSTGSSSSPVVRRLEQQGRPDLALVVEESLQARKAREARVS